ncbi:hypothetical protein [Rubritalea halochordaticola]
MSEGGENLFDYTGAEGALYSSGDGPGDEPRLALQLLEKESRFKLWTGRHMQGKKIKALEGYYQVRGDEIILDLSVAEELRATVMPDKLILRANGRDYSLHKRRGEILQSPFEIEGE